MTESRWTQGILRELRKRIPNAVFYKTNDRVTGGVPDVIVTIAGDTVWWEMKVARTLTVPFADLLSPKQRAYCSKLTRAGAAVIGVLRRPNGRVEGWRPIDGEWSRFVTLDSTRAFLDGICLSDTAQTSEGIR